MPRFSFQIDFDHPSSDRTLYFPRRPGRGAREDAVTDYSGVEGWYPLEKNSRHSIRWRGWVGTFIAEHLGYLENDKRAWHIDDWPPGYRLWLKERRKPSRNNRADVYLLGFGGRSRFESPQEFAFHAVWLYADEYHDTFPCECTLDTGRPQGEINAIWLQPEGPRLPIRAGPRSRVTGGGGGSGGGSRGRDVDMEARDDEPRSDIFDPGPKLVHWIPSKRSLLDGPVDDSEQSESPSRERGRLRSLLPFKNMELVWIKIPPIQAASSDDSITLWPALVTDGRSTGSAGTHQYEVRLLGVDSVCTVPEALVFPYQVKPLPRPSRSTTSASRSLPGNITSASQLPHFHPLPIPSNSAAAGDALERTYSNAIGPLKLASTVARDIAVQFCLMGQHVGDTQDPSSPKLYRWAWMGPQRIEPGDMVRLVPTREKLAELGISTMELLEESDGAGQACLFVQIVNIRLNEEGKAGFGGHLFELVPGRGRGQVEAAGLATLPLPPPGHTFRLLTPPTSPSFFELLWIAGRYEHLTFHSEAHRNFIENNLLGKQHLTYWDIQYRRGKELSQTVKQILSLTGLGLGAWNAITAKPVTVTGRQAGIQHAMKGARRLYFGDEEDDVTSSSENLSDDE